MVQAEQISKRFGDYLAVDQVSYHLDEVRSGAGRCGASIRDGVLSRTHPRDLCGGDFHGAPKLRAHPTGNRCTAPSRGVCPHQPRHQGWQDCLPETR